MVSRHWNTFLLLMLVNLPESFTIAIHTDLIKILNIELAILLSQPNIQKYITTHIVKKERAYPILIKIKILINTY